MALAIDASSPAVVGGVGPTVTTASFTPPSGSILLVRASMDGGASPAAPSITDNLGGHLTYTRTDWMSGNTSPNPGGQAVLWWAVVASSAAMTISVTNGDAGGPTTAVKVAVITGADTTTPIGAHGAVGSKSAASIAQSYTASATGGWGFIGVSDFDQLGAETAGTGCTASSDGGSANQGTAITYGFFHRTSADDVNGNSNTLNVTLPGTSTNLTWVYGEVLPASSGPVADLGGRSATGFHPGAGPTFARFYQTPRPYDVSSTPTTADTGQAGLGLAATVAAVHVAVGSADSRAGLAATTTVRKVAVVTATASVGLATTGTGRKVAPKTGTAAAGLSANAVHVPTSVDTGIVELGLAATSTTKKVAVVTCRATLGLAAGSTAKRVATDTGTATIGIAARDTAAKVGKDTGTAALGLSSNVSRVPSTQDTGVATLGLSARVATKKVVVASAVASIGLAGAATARKVAKASQVAALGVCGTVAAKKAVRTPGTASLALAARFAGTDSRTVTGRVVLGLQPQAHQCVTYHSFIGATARPDTGTTAHPDTGTTASPC